VILAEQGDNTGKKLHGEMAQDLLSIGKDPEFQDPNWRKRFRELFIKHMGAEAADVSERAGATW
jgi:hypothetical protein